MESLIVLEVSSRPAGKLPSAGTSLTQSPSCAPHWVVRVSYERDSVAAPGSERRTTTEEWRPASEALPLSALLMALERTLLSRELWCAVTLVFGADSIPSQVFTGHFLSTNFSESC